MSTPSSSSSGKPKPSASSRASAPARRRSRRSLTCLVAALLLLLIIVLAVSYALTHLFTSSSSTLLGNGDTRSAPTVASDFMDALKSQRYDRAYLDLDSTIQAQLTATDFDQQAQQADRCDGVVADYSLVDSTSQKAAMRFTYAVTRKKLTRSYRFVLQLAQQQGGSWTIVSYGGGASLLPPDAAPYS